MTTIADAVEAVSAWLEERVCPRIELKRPRPGKELDAADPEWANPAVYRMFTPPSSDPLTGAPRSLHPSVTVAVKSEARLADRECRFAVTLAIGTWSPGTHACEAPGGAPALSPDAGGWADGLRVAELAAAELRRCSVLGGSLYLDPSVPIAIGPWEDDGALVNFYPYYYTRMAFGAVGGTPPALLESDFL